MGSIISALGGLSTGLCACNQNKLRIGGVFCCVSRNVSSNSTQENKACEVKENFSSSDEFKDELTVNSDDTFLRKHRITQAFYINKNIGYFTTDTKGVFTYVSDNVVKFIGMPREDILQSISWVKNVEDNYSAYNKWTSKIEDKTMCVGKMHFTFNKKNYFIIFEFWPVLCGMNYVGVSGIFLNVEKYAWKIFDETDFKK
jgi:hypothetical protein